MFYVSLILFLTKKNNPCVACSRLHSHQNFPGSKLHYQAIQAGITRVDILAIHSLSNSSMVYWPLIFQTMNYVRSNKLKKFELSKVYVNIRTCEEIGTRKIGFMITAQLLSRR